MKAAIFCLSARASFSATARPDSAGERPNGLAKNVSNSYISLSDGRPTETEGTSEMKKYLIASVLIVGFAGSAYAANGQFGNIDRKSTRLNSSHSAKSRMPSSA